jgi:hypothetical protein
VGGENGKIAKKHRYNITYNENKTLYGRPVGFLKPPGVAESDRK